MPLIVAWSKEKGEGGRDLARLWFYRRAAISLRETVLLFNGRFFDKPLSRLATSARCPLIAHTPPRAQKPGGAFGFLVSGPRVHFYRPGGVLEAEKKFHKFVVLVL